MGKLPRKTLYPALSSEWHINSIRGMQALSLLSFAANKQGVLAMVVSKNCKRGAQILSILICGLIAAEARAAETSAAEAPAPFSIGNKFSRALQRYTGINYLAGFISSRVASGVVSHKLGNSVEAKVQVKTYSFTDLIAGKVRCVTVCLTPNIDRKSAESMPGSVIATTQHPVWINYRNKKKPKGVQSPVLVAIDGQLSEDDLANAVANPEVASRLKLLKIDLPGMGSQQIQVLNPNVQLQGNKVRLEGKLCAANADPKSAVQVCFVGEPALEGDYRIVVKNVQVDSNTIDSPNYFAQFAQQLMNPLVDFRRMDKHNRAIRMQNLKVADNRVQFNAKLLLAPRPVSQLAQGKR